jgi:hypothetical protein
MATKTRGSCEELFRRELAEVWTGDDLSIVDELYAPEFRSGTTRAGAGTAPLGDREVIKGMHAEWDAAFPGMETEILALVVDGETVLAHWEAAGTHERAFRGIEPTSRDVSVKGFSCRRAEDGQFVEATD